MSNKTHENYFQVYNMITIRHEIEENRNLFTK